MSQNRRGRDIATRADEAVRGLRRGNGTPNIVGGYLVSPSGRAQANPGDEKFPYIKDPPDIEGPVRYITPTQLNGEGGVDNPIPLVAVFDDFLILDLIDVAETRILTLFQAYYPGAADASLSIVPEVQRDDNTGDWYSAGVVDGTITASTFVPGGGVRTTYATELASPAAGLTSPDSIKKALSFDVGDHRTFRLRVGDTVSAFSGLDLFYSLMR